MKTARRCGTGEQSGAERMLRRIKEWARAIRRMSTPSGSPIDLIPDFIPVLGYLDDVILLPLGIAAALKLVPADVMVECRAKAAASTLGQGRAGIVVAVLIVACWIALGAWAAHWMLAP